MDLPKGKRVQVQMELLAAVDVGSNTVRMLVAGRERGRLRPVLRMRRITGLARELRATGAIGKEELKETVAALRLFSSEMKRRGVSGYRAVGTAALREASNREILLAEAKKAGIRIEVISASEEAKRTWEGVRGTIRGSGETVVMDIGGGSTEFIAGPGAAESVSLPIGVAMLCGLFPISDPPSEWQTRNLRLYLDDRIAAGTRRWGKRKFRRLAGTAGTFTTIAALDLKMKAYRPERIDGYEMPLSRLKTWEKRLYRLSEAGRLALPGMERGRERFIVPGVCQAVAAMERFGTDTLVVSDAGLLEGIVQGIAT